MYINALLKAAGHTTLVLVLFQLEYLVMAAHSESDANSGAVITRARKRAG